MRILMETKITLSDYNEREQEFIIIATETYKPLIVKNFLTLGYNKLVGLEENLKILDQINEGIRKLEVKPKDI